MGLGQCKERVETNLYAASARGRNQTHRARDGDGDKPSPIAVRIGGKYDDDGNLEVWSLHELSRILEELNSCSPLASKA